MANAYKISNVLQDAKNFIVKYNEVGLVLTKHHLLANMQYSFLDEAICTYVPSDGSTSMFVEGASVLENVVHGPGTFLDLKTLTNSSVLNSSRKVLFTQGGATLCLTAAPGIDATASFAEGKDLILQPNTMAIILEGYVEFIEDGTVKIADQYDLILKRPQALQLLGECKAFLVI